MTRLQPDPAEPLGSVHTGNFPELLRQLGCSLLATTFQAGRLIFVRPQSRATSARARLLSSFHGVLG